MENAKNTLYIGQFRRYQAEKVIFHRLHSIKGVTRHHLVSLTQLVFNVWLLLIIATYATFLLVVVD